MIFSDKKVKIVIIFCLIYFMERATNNHPESRLSLPQVHAGLVSTYNSRLDFQEAIRWADKGDSPYPIFADAWELLTDEQRKMVESNQGYIEDRLALALARGGDFSPARKLMSRRDFLIETPGGHRFLWQRVDWCLELAEIETKQEINPDNTYHQALEVARKYLTRSNELHRPGINHESLGCFAKIAKSRYRNGKDCQGVLAEMDRMLEELKSPSGYSYYFQIVAKAFAFCGFLDRANELAQKCDRKGRSEVLLAIALRQVSQGNIEEAIKTAKSSQNDTMLAEILAKGALFTAQNRSGNKQLLTQVQETIDRLDDKRVGVTKKAELYLLLAKAAHHSSQPFNTYIEKVLALSLAQEDLIARTELLIILAKTQAELDGGHKPTFIRALETMEHLYADTNKDDKLDSVETLMATEEIIDATIDLSLFDEAKMLIQHLLVRGEVKGTEGFEEAEFQFIAKFYARIAVSEAKIGLGEDELKAILRSAIDRLVRSNDHRLLEALGYFDLIDEAMVKTLSPDRVVSISLGRAKRKGIKDENLDYLEQVYRKADNSRVTRAIVEGLSDQRPEEAADRLHALLELELKGPRDPKVIARLIKGLIEMGDSGAKEIATLLFMDEIFPSHLRLYLAKKLCDSGLWDRQIIFYFQNYRAQGRSIQNFAMDVQIDSLAAIIKQMHLTPTLTVYKILEKTRLKQDKEALTALAGFGARVFLLPDLNLQEKVSIFSFWAEKFESGEMDSSQLEVLNGNMSLFLQAKNRYLVRNNLDGRTESVNDNLKSLLVTGQMREHCEQMSFLLENGIFPTPALVRFISQNGLESIGRLAVLRHQTENGQFDPANKLQRDLELTKYLLLSGAGPDKAYRQFAKLEFVLPSEETFRQLSPKEMLEAEAAAFEAAKLYWFIRQRVEAGRKVTVIGNQRYGDYFVTEPLRADLEELGVQVCFFRVGSTGAGRDMVAGIFPDSFIESFITEAPDIVIVDGTKAPHDRQVRPRFPNSMSVYLNWFTAFNEAAGLQAVNRNPLRRHENYQKLVAKISLFSPQKPFTFSHWLPKPAEKVSIGEETVAYQEPTLDEPNVIFANPVIDPKKDDSFPKELSGHQPGSLDDPDKLINGEKIIVMTLSGVKQIVKGHGDEAQLVNSIQMHMSKVMPRYIRKTDPALER